MKKVLLAMGQTEAEPPVLDEQPPAELPLLPCHVCSRTFLPKPLEKHIRICEQTARRKRKPFDSLKQRVEGTDMAPFYQKSYLKKSNPEMSSQATAGDVYGNNKPSKWREKHFELQNTIKHAKGTKLDMSTNPPTNTSSITPNRKVGHLTVRQVSTNERCPVCDRSFGPKAFDRHVEFCREQKNRVPAHKSPAVVQQAKERLEARINYRVPPLKQTKRSLVREKYCPSSQTNLLLRSNSIVSGKSSNVLSSSVPTMMPNRRPSMNDKSIERSSKTEVVSKTRLDKTMGDCGDIKEITKNESSNSNKSFHTKRTTPAKKINKTEINDSLQEMTVSCLSVEKDKKLVTWKDTVKVQPKVTTSISLTTTRSNVKKIVDCNNKGESRKELDKSSSLGKVFKSRLLTEKLSLLMKKKKSEEVEVAEELEPTNLNDSIKEALLEDLELTDSNEEMHDIGNEEALDFSELNDISEEGELEDESPKDMTESHSDNLKRRTVSYVTDVEDEEQEVENPAEPSLDRKANFSDKYNITSSDEQSEQECVGREIECAKFDSGEDTRTEDTSSLCLRLPLEGMESRVQLKNNDLDPDQKLRNNIKGFYEIMRTRRQKIAKEREQLCLLESSKDIRCHLDSSPVKTMVNLSAESSKVEIDMVEKFEENDLCEKVVEESPLDIVETDSTITRNDCIRNEKRNCTIRSASSVSKGNVTFTISSRHFRTWKRRKKVKKYRMCVNCFIRKSRHLRWKVKIKRYNLFHLETSDVETDYDSPQTLEEESCPKHSEDPTISKKILSRKSRSADCIKMDQWMFSNEIPGGKIFHSHPNILLTQENSNVTNTIHRLSSENSFDYVIPRKKRKISASYMNLMSDEEKTELNLKQNISKIRKRKKEEEPPLILDYDNIGPSVSITSASVLYINKVFTTSLTPERSEIDSVDDFEDEGIKEYGDEVLEGWEVAEEELRKELEKRKILTRCESPTKLSKSNIGSSVHEESDNSIERSNINIDMERTESANTLKNSSACTIVNINCGETTSANSMLLPRLERDNEVNMIKLEQDHVKTDLSKETSFFEPKELSAAVEKKPCRLPRIINRSKQTDVLRNLKESTKTYLKLPAISNMGPVKEANMPNDKLIQVPSEITKESISFCQQTSNMWIDESLSINKDDMMEETRNKLSSTEILTNSNYDPFEKAHLQLMELIADDDDDNSTTPSHSNTASSRSTPTTNTKFRPFFSTPKTIDNRSGAKRASVIDPPYSFQDNRASRDLDQEFELLESLMNNNLDSVDSGRHSDSIDRVSLHRTDEVDVIDPRLINERDDLHIPERLPSDEHSPVCNEAYGRIEYANRAAREARIGGRPSRSSIGPTARSLPLVRPGRVRPAPDGSSAESQTGEGRRDSSRSRRTAKTKSNTRIDSSPESLKSRTSRRLGTSSLSVHAGLDIRKTSSEGLEEKVECFNLTRTPTAEELYPDNPSMYEEFRKYEEMYRREKESRSSSSKKQKKKTADFGINIEEDSKAYGDSAYGSLNRKQELKDPESSDQTREFGSKVQSASTNSGERLPKYCHECGNKYPVATAKFCVECGVKRLVL